MSVITLRFDGSIINRAYGKPAVKEEREGVDLPPVVIELTGPSRWTSIKLFSQSSHLIFSLFVTDSLLGKMLQQKQ
jgi:hypothetical protein